MMNAFPFLAGVIVGCILSGALVLHWIADGLNDQGEEQERDQ